LETCLFVLLTFFLSAGAAWGGDFGLPQMLSPEEYGDVLMDRSSIKSGVTPVVFSHWVHRVKYTCRVCHDELEFAMKADATPLECEKGTMKGKHCAACHNGKDAFGPKGEGADNCKRCHNADASPNSEKFFALREKLPKAKFGNRINWVKAMNDGLITPRDDLAGRKRTIVHDKTLTLRAEMAWIPSAVFPHKTHEQWMDCSDCHPALFNIQKKTTRSLTMQNMFKGESCAVCHLRISFPLNDCKRCHPTMSVNMGFPIGTGSPRLRR
jgi:c(7)-type cytochrome triheme protein